MVDWLVMMRRLPANLMLDHLLEAGTAAAEHMRRVAAQLAAFYRGLQPGRHRSGALPATGCAATSTNAERKLCDPEVGVCADEARPLCAQLRSVLRARPEPFVARVQAGRSSRATAICVPSTSAWKTPPAIIDCLEFSAELRTLDIADELGFLGLECERLGAPRLGPVLFDVYGRADRRSSRGGAGRLSTRAFAPASAPASRSGT